jgi:hypothetical protein
MQLSWNDNIVNGDSSLRCAPFRMTFLSLISMQNGYETDATQFARQNCEWRFFASLRMTDDRGLR